MANHCRSFLSTVLSDRLFFFVLHGVQFSLDHDGTFNTFLLQFAAQFVRFFDAAAEGFVVRMATAGAEELSPASGAGRLRKYVRVAEFTRNVEILKTFVHIAQYIAVAAYELMARIYFGTIKGSFWTLNQFGT